MPCYHPLLAYRSAVRSETGKRPLKFSPKGAFVDLTEKIPCGQCIGCRLEKARQWAVRCMHEASMFEENSFITLTYSPENIPEDGSVHKRDVQLFFKRLRRTCKNCMKHESVCECEKFERIEVRYYACGEYGSKLSRPHYHAVLFGFDFPDKELLYSARYFEKDGKIKKNSGNDLFRSPGLESIWPFGFSTVGSVTFESAGYVARYVMKKITGEMKNDHYGKRRPEFALMSRRPGVGKTWFDRFSADVFPKDYFTLRGKKMRPPKYYDYLLDIEDPKMIKEIKQKRKNEAEKTADSGIRLLEREKYKKRQTKSLRRGFEENE